MFVLALTLLLALPAPQAANTDRCDRLYAETDALYTQLVGQHPKPISELRRLVFRASETRRCYGNDNRHRVMDLYYDEVFAHRWLRQYQEAFDVLDDFFEHFAATPDSDWFPVMYAFRGNLNEAVGDLPEAIADYGRAFAYESAEQPDAQANLLINAGVILRGMQDFDAARSYFEHAAQLLQDAPAHEHGPLRQRARALHELANLVLMQAAANPADYADALAEASQQFRESISLDREAGARRERFYSVLALGEALSYQDSLRAAEHHLREAASIAAALGDPALQGFAAYRLGRLHLQRRTYDAAHRAFTSALPLAEAGKNGEYRRRILNATGLLHELRGDYEQARQVYQRAIAVTEEARAALGATQWSALAFSQWQEPYRGLVRTLLALQRPVEAFAALEQTRARHLRDLQLQARLLADTSFAQRSRLDSLNAALEDIRNRLGHLADPGAARTELLAAEGRLAATRDALLAVDDTRPLPSLQAIQRQLARRDRVLVAYFLDQPDPLFGRAAQSSAFLLTADTLTTYPLEADAPAIQSVLAQVSPLLSVEGNATGGLNAFQFSNAALKRLYDLIFAPLADHIPAGAPLVVLPDGPLFMVPFGALLTADAAPYQYREAPFLLRRHSITIELAASLLVDPPAPRPEPTLDVLAFGKTQFPGTRLPRAYYAPVALAADSSLPSLPAVAEELSSIQALFGQTEVMRDGAATEEAFLARLGAAKVVHVASHALLNPFSPLHDAIVLTPGDAPDDGLLYLHELQNHDLDAHLVVLSGCNTARGVLLTGEGMAGLQYAFRSIGVASTVATLWLVEDDASARLMTLFYRNLRNGQPKDIALQQAQLTFLEQAPGTRTSPFFWAAPVLYGNADPIALAPRTWGAEQVPWMLAGLLLALAAAVFYLRKRRRGRGQTAK
jgi:CHAT domain-containing protein/predicted negative regulator of RcsB-dependent stress response